MKLYSTRDAHAVEKALWNLSKVGFDGKDVPLQHAVVLFDVAAHPETSVGEVGRRLGLTSGTLSRAVAALSDWSWTHKPGHGLIRKDVDRYEMRRRILTLTPKGLEAVYSTIELLKEGLKSRQDQEAVNS